MALIELSGAVDPSGVLRGLNRAQARGAPMERTTFRFGRGADPSPGALALLAAWLLADRQNGGDPLVTGDSVVLEKLARVDRHRLLGLPYQSMPPDPKVVSPGVV